jgi:alkanesulfonate monooxygenase SsuD/methylene tetrahydromethanopterin reductase-like flavin-dependent oxidoreductase (luciferase family)
MITKFDSSYYGTVDMENLGYAGTPINERRYSQAELGGALQKVVEYAKWMDERGYDTFWMAEHHFQPEGTELIPNLLMMAMHLCGVTKNLRIGCGFNVVPMWHPLRLAEDYAMADILTGGRVIFGVARGYHTREVETFGAPLRDQKANRELFEEGVDILFKAFEGKPFSHKGKYYTIPPEVPYRGYTLKEITLVPAPERLPVECWQPAGDPPRGSAGRPGSIREGGHARLPPGQDRRSGGVVQPGGVPANGPRSTPSVTV